MSDEVEIVEIRAAGPVEKRDDHWARYQGKWVVPVEYVLADGRVIAATDRSSLKRDAVAFHASLPKAPGNPMSASFMDGEFIGTRTSYSIGGLAAAQARL